MKGIKEVGTELFDPIDIETIELSECYQTNGVWSIINKHFRKNKVRQIDMSSFHAYDLYLVLDKDKIRLWRNKK